MRDYPHASHYALVELSLLRKEEKENEEKLRQLRLKELISIEQIINDVCEVFKVSIAELMTINRIRKLVILRKIISYVGKTKTTYTQKIIAEKLGYKEHSTVVHHTQQVRGFLKVGDPDFLSHWNHFLTNSKLFKPEDFQ